MALAALMAAGDFPHLERHELDGEWEGTVAALADGLRSGACPKLESLGVFYEDNVDKNSDKIMEALAELVESRQHLPGCSPIKELDGDWLHFGSVHGGFRRDARPHLVGGKRKNQIK